MATSYGLGWLGVVPHGLLNLLRVPSCRYGNGSAFGGFCAGICPDGYGDTVGKSVEHFFTKNGGVLLHGEGITNGLTYRKWW